VTAARPSLLFVANPWLPYWRARVDGSEARLLRAHYAFQAIPVPAGEREVTLEFHSDPLRAAVAVSGAAAAFLVAGALFTIARRRKGGGDGA